MIMPGKRLFQETAIYISVPVNML